MATEAKSYRPAHALVSAGVDGGFIPVPAGELLAVWRLYADGRIELRDLRLWLASHLLAAEARFRGHTLPDRMTGDQLRSRTTDGRSSGAVVRRLTRVRGLVETEPRVESPYFRNLRRRVPVPRRLLKHLAVDGSRATIAAAVGHLLRCLYWRGDACVSGGTAKAACLADELRVSLRSIRRGRRELIDQGWLESVEMPQHVLNRHGAVMRVRSGGGIRRRRLAPPRPDSRRRLAPPRNRNQLRCLLEPRTGRVHGSDVGRQRERLRDRGFVEKQFERLAQRGDVARSEAARLAVLSCAAYAARVASRSPMGLFWHLVRGGHWGRPAQLDEDLARAPSPQRKASEPERLNAVMRAPELAHVFEQMQHLSARSAQRT